MRMPVSFPGEFRLHIVIDQVLDKDEVPWLAIAILVHLHSHPIYGRLSQISRRILFDRSDDDGSKHSLSRYVVFAPKKLPAVRSRLPLYAPKAPLLISQTHYCPSP